jgi:hypothetical protein
MQSCLNLILTYVWFSWISVIVLTVRVLVISFCSICSCAIYRINATDKGLFNVGIKCKKTPTKKQE